MPVEFHPDEFIPDKDVAWLVSRMDVQRLIRPFEEQVERPLCVRVVLCAGKKEIELGPVSGTAAPDNQNSPVGMLKLRFRQTFRKDRILYCAHALYDPDAVLPGSGFSGFKASGEVLLEQGESSVKPRGVLVNLYNDFSWTGWFW